VVDPPYRVAAPNQEGGFELRGVFADGVWEGFVYSNGSSEDQNPTPLQTVSDALQASIQEVLDAAAAYGED
jgi:hypothetical protein